MIKGIFCNVIIKNLVIQGFLELTQLKEIKLSSEKLKLKRRIPINGTEAMPEKKLYKVIIFACLGKVVLLFLKSKYDV